MFQATTMGMYAAIAAVVGGHYVSVELKSTSLIKLLAWICLFLSLMTVLFTQSRIALFVLAIILMSYSVKLFNKQTLLSVVLGVSLLILAFLPRIYPSYFSRFQTQSINRGIDTRLDLYATSLYSLVKHNVILGNGPDTLPDGSGVDSFGCSNFILWLLTRITKLSKHLTSIPLLGL